MNIIEGSIEKGRFVSDDGIIVVRTQKRIQILRVMKGRMYPWVLGQKDLKVVEN